MSIVNIQALKDLGAVLHWPGAYAESGAYDDDGNKRGFMILPDGVTVTPSGTFTTQKMKDGRNIWKFDGSNNVVGASNNNAFYFQNNDFTICGWFCISSLSTHSILFGWGDTTLTASTRVIQMYVSVTTGILVYAIWNTSSTPASYTTAYGCSANIWYHFAITRNGNSIKLYINSNVVDSQTYTDTLQDPTTSFGIGGAGVLYPTSRTTGNFKDLMIFRKALTLDQIAAIMQETYIY